jgi:gluconokinase
VTRVLALDVGTSSARAQLFDERANEAGDRAQEEYAGEHDPDRLVEAVQRTIDAAAGDGFEAVGTSCFGHSLLALDGDDRPLTPVLDWRDRRSAAAAERLSTVLDAKAVHARTGCHVHTSYWPAKLAWLAEELPDVMRNAARFVTFDGLLYERLLGRAAPISLSSASATGLFDLRRRGWDVELLDVLGLGTGRLPELSGDPVDRWYPALLDGACSNLGAGCIERSRAVLMIGTSGAFRTLYETTSLAPRDGLFLYAVDERRVLEGGALSDGGNVHQWLDEVLKNGSAPVEDRPPAAHGLTFLTLLGGDRSPGWRSRARGAVAGLTTETTALDLRQAALEGIAYRFAEVAELMPEVEEIVAAGGALRHDPDWLQILADVLERPLVLSGVEEASLRGAAVAVLERLGVSIERAPLGRTVEPRADRAEAHRAARARQRELYDALIG